MEKSEAGRKERLGYAIERVRKLAAGLDDVSWLLLFNEDDPVYYPPQKGKGQVFRAMSAAQRRYLHALEPDFVLALIEAYLLRDQADQEFYRQLDELAFLMRETALSVNPTDKADILRRAVKEIARLRHESHSWEGKIDHLKWQHERELALIREERRAERIRRMGAADGRLIGLFD